MQRVNTCRLPAALEPEEYLDGPATGRNEGLDGSGVVSSCKLLLLSLAPSHHGDGQQLFIHPGIQLQDLHHLHNMVLRWILCPFRTWGHITTLRSVHILYKKVCVCDLDYCFLPGSEGRVSLLPQELSGPQERLRVFELPPLDGERVGRS